jgi:hypothetical protein
LFFYNNLHKNYIIISKGGASHSLPCIKPHVLNIPLPSNIVTLKTMSPRGDALKPHTNHSVCLEILLHLPTFGYLGTIENKLEEGRMDPELGLHSISHGFQGQASI